MAASESDVCTLERRKYLVTENLNLLSDLVDFVQKKTSMKLFHSLHVSVLKTFAHVKQQHLFGFLTHLQTCQKMQCVQFLEQSQKGQT